jgi:hypothetical protein
VGATGPSNHMRGRVELEGDMGMGHQDCVRLDCCGDCLEKWSTAHILSRNIKISQPERDVSQSRRKEKRVILPGSSEPGYRWLIISRSASHLAESAFKDMICACKNHLFRNISISCNESPEQASSFFFFHTSVSILLPLYQKPSTPYDEAS